MANIRNTYSATALSTATGLHPTQITARQTACIRMNGRIRVQSTFSDALSVPEIWLESNQLRTFPAIRRNSVAKTFTPHKPRPEGVALQRQPPAFAPPAMGIRGVPGIRCTDSGARGVGARRQ